MVKIKLCGLQCLHDVEMVNQFSIDYAGFIFAKSKRRIDPQDAKICIEQLTHAKSVGVFVNEEVKEIERIANLCKLDVLQLHGEEAQEDILYLRKHTPCLIWKAIRVRTLQDVTRWISLQPDRFLYDSYEEGVYGGTGKTIQTSLLSQINLSKIMLAGGIHSANVKQKIALHPYGIDVSSGVETEGKKDYHKLEQFMKEVMTI